jgi:hypothetical protein
MVMVWKSPFERWAVTQDNSRATGVSILQG